MIDPDIVCPIQGDGITAPNVFRVDIGDLNVLEDDILSPVHNSQALAFDDALRAIADDCLIRTNSDTESSSSIISDARDRRCIRFVVLAPLVLVDSSLASSASTPCVRARLAICLSL
jgi:hypothetical protein